MSMPHALNVYFLYKNWVALGQIEETRGDFDIVKIRKTGSKTGQGRFRIFVSIIFRSLGQYKSNGIPHVVPEALAPEIGPIDLLKGNLDA